MPKSAAISSALLQVENLKVSFDTVEGPVSALAGLDLSLGHRERVAVIGESGSGKSVLAHAVLRLMEPSARVRGEIRFKGEDLSALSAGRFRALYGRSMALVPQSAAGAFNPVERIGAQICRFLSKTSIARGDEARSRALDDLDGAGFQDPERIFSAYPHMLSGGMRQRALIAMCTAARPELLIADEPTKGLDPQGAKAVLSHLMATTNDRALLMITHDIRAAAICHRVEVMYRGEVVESGPAGAVLSDPAHYYTRGLVQALPENGMTPIPLDPGPPPETGCRFRKRCSGATPKCLEKPGLEPEPKRVPPGTSQERSATRGENREGLRRVRCHHA